MTLKKEEVRSDFHQLHGLLAIRETFLLKEMDEVVTRARQEVAEKRATLQSLYAAQGRSRERPDTEETEETTREESTCYRR